MKNLLSLIALTLCLCFAASTKIQAQDYKAAAGLRLGYPWAASYKMFISEASAVEVYAGYRGWFGYNAVSLNGAYQIHNDIESIDGLKWYYGVGGGVDFVNYSAFNESSTVIKIAGYLGLEYTFPDTPISVTADWVPTFGIGDELFGFNTAGFRAGYGGLGVRYILNRGGQ